MSQINSTIMECVWPQSDTPAGSCQSSVVGIFMPFRLDYILWGLCLAIVVYRRLHINLETEAKYVRMKYMTWALDYSYMFFGMWICDNYLSVDFSPENIFKHQVFNAFGIIVMDLLKAALFWNLLAKAKTEHLKHLWNSLQHALFTSRGWKDNFKFFGKILSGQGILTEFDIGKSSRRSVRHNIWYMCKIGLFAIPLVTAIQVKIGMFTCEPLNDIIYVAGEGKWYETHISRFLKVYLEYLLISFIKDALCMNIMHQMFHSCWYDHHEIHHLPMKNLSTLNAFYFDVPDLFLEDGVGPMLLMGLKALGGGDCSVHYMSFYFVVVCDQFVHSLNPYTAVFWNPLFDNMMRGAVSHNLHHALNKGHYTIWPQHHIIGVETPNHKTGKAMDGFEIDILEYNNIFDTKFPLKL